MTMTRPWRRMTRHLLQIRLTLGLTFTVCLTFRSKPGVAPRHGAPGCEDGLEMTPAVATQR
jgi:hypothetical protein